ncbi:universal stress protein [Thermodesulfatator atlanticus]|uniref:universal stress protein n=1 Tax=Thermodesulfatator atlanticus TaxID=501497 RepID=UPI0003B64D2A|nr:universal stress protein [Thermodesulfatator atlanticus]
MNWKIQKILFPFDGSEEAAIAFDPAIYLAKKENAEVICLYVIHLPSLWAAPIDVEREDLIATLRIDAEKALEKAVKKFEEAGINISKVVREGSPSTEIAKLAAEKDVDLIVMASHGAHSTKSYLGSVARGVLDRTNKTVLIVKSPELPDPFAIP